MPIQIDRTRAQALAPHLDEALELVRNESRGSTYTGSTATPSPGS